MNKQKIIIALTVLVDVIGLGIVLPSLPFYVDKMGGSSLEVTYLFAVFSICSFLSTPLLGALSDRIGRRPILILSIASTAIGWFVFASAKSLVFLFLGRIIDGLAAGNFSTAQSYLVDISKDDRERTQNLGLIGSMFGIGFILGPMLGGFLVAVSPSFPFWVAGILASINMVMAIIFLPETNQTRNLEKIHFNPFQPIARAVKNKKLFPYFLTWFLFGTAISGSHSIMALYFNDRFGFNAFVIGIIIAAQGVIMSFNQIIGLKRFWLRRFREPDLTLFMILAFAVSYLFMGTSHAIFFFLGILFAVFSQSVLRVVFTSEVLGLAQPRVKGEVLGMLASVMSLGMIVGPLFTGPIYAFRNNFPFFVSAVLMFIAFVVFYQNRQKLSRLKPDESAQINVV
jgi:DHA1 family tetracycline resistance protein-like MFS transporter